MRKRKKLTPKRVLKIIAGVVIFFTLPTLLLYGFLYFKYNEDLPIGEETELADILATKMLNSLNHDAYKATDYIEFTFKKRHHFKWNKTENTCEVYWKNYKVNLDLKDSSKSEAFQSDIKIEGEESKELIAKALSYFNNDTFWVVAPYKVFDEGTKRSVVTLENNEKALLVNYTSGGSTPGDSYLWHLDENGKPKSFKMWTSILPIDGLEATWSDWTTTETGAMLPTFHKLMVLGLEIDGIKVQQNEIDLKDDDIISLDVTYMQSGIHIAVSLGCVVSYLKNRSIDQTYYSKKSGLFYNKIRERDFLNNFKDELENLSKSINDKNIIDGRISVLINYSNKKIDTLCMGENFGTLLNNQLMNDSPDLFKILKKRIRYELAFSDPFEEYR